ncbi:hypothetical protein J2W68_002267 [Luteimonas terrae]|uniref:Cytochrome oxidase complex assembly protein 1 n=2 Tax=Luteimonas terrae TaxID=1530191 RepID=A0ABU1XXN6_9GAMM|nr:hypothetical protein [Luteimonas terrae]
MPPLPRGWWQRNWKWAVPLAVLALLSVALVFVALVLFAVRGSMQSSDVYADALARARAHPDLVVRLGEPMTPGFMPMGRIDTSTEGGGSGYADLTFTLSGPHGSGRITATAERMRGVWLYEQLVFMPPRGIDGRIDLVERGTPVGPADALP